MDQQVSLDLLGGAERQFHVGAVHRIARLKRDDAAPAHASKFRPQFGGSQTQAAKIVMRRDLQTLDFSAHVPRIRLVDSIIGAGMSGAGGAENRFGFRFPIWLPDLFDVQCGQHYAFRIAQRNFAAARRELLGEFLGDIQGDGHRPKNATRPAAYSGRRLRSRLAS